jgi:SAM-dependent methyltransferase
MEPPYRLLYRLGFTPWDRDEVPGPVTELADELAASPGRALDIGCGTGRDAVYLAGRGWTVTGVDAVPQAIDGARRRAEAAGADVNWVLGDVTALQSLGIGEGYDLLLDRGCFHGLSDEGRQRCAQGLTAIAAPGARMLLNGFQPRGRGLGPRGIAPEQLTSYFRDGWELLAAVPDTEAKLPRWLGAARPTWYRLQRRS